MIGLCIVCTNLFQSTGGRVEVGCSDQALVELKGQERLRQSSQERLDGRRNHLAVQLIRVLETSGQKSVHLRGHSRRPVESGGLQKSPPLQPGYARLQEVHVVQAGTVVQVPLLSRGLSRDDGDVLLQGLVLPSTA